MLSGHTAPGGVLGGGSSTRRQHGRRASSSSSSGVTSGTLRARSMAGSRGGGFGDSPLIMGPSGSPMGRNAGPPGAPGRLILPGQGGLGRGGGPQQQRAPGGRPGPPVGLDGPEPSSGLGQLPPAHKYRPPPGFMNADAQDPALNQTDPQEMLNKLRSRAGQWHQLARLLPVLYAKGLDTNTISELAGLNPVEQNAWVVAGTVYDSIQACGKVDEAVLAHFDGSEGADKLYHFRFLPAERRAAAAVFILDRRLDPRDCDVLARAMKEWDRRPTERTGFNDGPGDCMAFKYLRDAIECRSPSEAAEKLELAFAAAESESAVTRLTEWRESELAERSSAGGAATLATRSVLTVLRLQQDELGFRPLPQVSPLAELSVDELQWAPRTSQEGAFGVFELQAGGQGAMQKWVALPQWKALAMARQPVAIPLPDCAANPEVLAASRAQTPEEKKKLTGVGLLVVDVEPSTAELDPGAYYLVRAASGSQQALQLLPGAQLAAGGGGRADVVASVLFLVRPPNRESSITSSELLQL